MARGGRFADNPFYVLGVRPSASRLEIEREGQKLLGMIELGLRAASTYATPVGPRPRSADAVRGAMADVRAPERRILRELWATLPAEATRPPPSPPEGDPFRRDDAPAPAPAQSGWEGAFSLFGWRRP
ncbi:MAG: hypothetical protein R3B09_23050 [Nannocystaceae bacterium]